MLLRHLRQHIVRRPVDNPHNLRDAVRRQALLQRLDDGNAPADARLIEEVDIVLSRCSIELGKMLCNDILIRRDDVLARRHRTQHIVLGGRESAHHLDHNRDLRIIQDLVKIVCKRNALSLGTMFFCIAHENLCDLNMCAAASRNRVCIHRERAHHAGADRSRTEQCNLNRIHQISSPSQACPITSSRCTPSTTSTFSSKV